MFKINTDNLTGESKAFAEQLNSAFKDIPAGVSKEDIQIAIQEKTKVFFDEKGATVSEGKAFTEVMKAVIGEFNTLQNDFTEYKKQAGKLRGIASEQTKSFMEAWLDGIDNNMANLKAGKKFDMELKGVRNMNYKTAAGDMTNTTFGGGSSIAIPTIRPDAVLKPGYPVLFRDIVDVVPSSTGLYWQHVENGGNGGFATQTEGSAKNQVDYNFQREIIQANYIQGYARPTRQLLQDNAYLQQALPKMLLRDFFIQESQAFYSALTGLISAATSTGANRFDQITNCIAEIEEANFVPNHVIAKPSDFASLFTSKATGSGEYLKPGNLTFSDKGEVTFNGIMPVKGNWVTKGQALIGDFSYAHIVQAEDISIRFFEQDGNNVTQNKITVLCEAREGLAVDLTTAFKYVNLV